MIIATRNRLIHAYLGIDNDIIWSIIQDDIPELMMALRSLIVTVHGLRSTWEQGRCFFAGEVG